LPLRGKANCGAAQLNRYAQEINYQMKPGQLEPNELEIAILDNISSDIPALKELISGLHVISREYTGVGSYTNFLSSKTSSELGDQPVGLKAHISIPGVLSGLGAVLFFEKGGPKFLEIYSYGDDHWNGLYQGFTINKLA